MSHTKEKFKFKHSSKNKKVNSIGIKFPLESSSQGAFATNDTTIDVMRDDLRMLILTNHGERPMKYDFGANLISAIFDQTDEFLEQKIKDLISNAVAIWLPQVTIDNIEVKTSINDNTVPPNKVRIKIFFSVGTESSSLEETI